MFSGSEVLTLVYISNLLACVVDRLETKVATQELRKFAIGNDIATNLLEERTVWIR